MSIYDKASLVLIPSGTKTSKVYSQKPTNGDGDFTFSRSTAATRVNASGNIEKETQNLARYSNDFSNSVWYKYTNTTYTLTTETITDPFGVSTSVYKVTLTGSGYLTLRQEFSGDTRYMTASAYIKKSSSGLNVALDQSDGNVENAAANTDWQRLSSSHASGYGFSFIDITITGVSGDYCYVSSAQMELGGAARDYIETTTTAIYGGITDNVPRLDYTDSSCPALLLEPQRTNSITHSEYFGAWTPSGLTITDNDAATPEGVSNAAKLTLPSGSAAKRIALGSMPVTAVARSYSFFVKSDDITAVQLVHSGDIQGYARFNISTGAVGSTGSKTTSTIEDYGNGWYRCIANFDSTNAFGSTIYLYINDSATGGYGGSTSAQGDLFVYGAQYEEGSYATSYIPTYGSAVTRNQDTGSIPSASSLIGQTEGTLFLKFKHTNEAVGLVGINAGNIGNRLYIGTDTNGLISQVRVSYSTQAFFDTSLTIGTTYKCALAYKENDFVLYVNGSQIGVDTNGLVPSSLSRIAFQQANGNDSMPQPLNEVLVFKTRLTNAELATLTTI